MSQNTKLAEALSRTAAPLAPFPEASAASWSTCDAHEDGAMMQCAHPDAAVLSCIHALARSQVTARTTGPTNSSAIP